ncbi:MAG: porin family protein [Bacteroidota bacterium]|nr:porin family protein [Bacteroidota bacterium]
MKEHTIKNRLTTVFLSVFIAISVSAQQKQSTCSGSLTAANKEYEAGRFSQCVEILKPCIENLSAEVQFEAYRLMALSYINQNENEKTHEAIVNLLRHKPDYRDFPYFDPLEFTKLLAKYDVWALLEMGMKGGMNFNTVRPIKNYSVTGSPAEFSPGTGYQAGFVAEYFFRKNISVDAEFLYEGLNYGRKATNVSGWSQEFTEKLNYFNIPVTGRYYFYRWNALQFAAELGMQMQLFNATNSNIILKNNITGENVQNTIEQSKQRSSTLYYALAGLAVKYKLGGGNLCLNARYAYGFSNIVNADKRYDDLDFILANQYVDSDISFNPLYISLGYQFPLQGLYVVKLSKK